MERPYFLLFLIFLLSNENLSFVYSRPNKSDSANYLNDLSPPEIYKMHISSTISNRFARTTVYSKVRNNNEISQETTFFVILPDQAFISNFKIEINKVNYTAIIKKKEEAQRQYNEAKSIGLTAAHIDTTARDSNRFKVSINVKPLAKVAFYLTYEEVLQRKNGRYELLININPGQPVQDLSIKVFIKERQKITLLETPPLRSGNEIVNNDLRLTPNVVMTGINETSAEIHFSPNMAKQKEFSRYLKNNQEDGLAGQFVVQYDVERNLSGGTVLVWEGYFVHFFAPKNLETLPKHVVFLLDTSPSMEGLKVQQLREAISLILNQLHSNDLFHLVEFNTNVKVWNLNDPTQSVWFPLSNQELNWNTYTGEEDDVKVENFVFPSASTVNSFNVKKAVECVSQFEATVDGATDIYSALRVALQLVNATKKMETAKNHQSLIMFLTDGYPNFRHLNSSAIRIEISAINRKVGAAIFALSLGSEADKYFVRQLARRNHGFARYIYPDFDTSLQLKDFYGTISSPLLQNVKFHYQQTNVISLTIDTYPVFYDGSEIMVAGQCGNMDSTDFYVTGYTNKGISSMVPVIKRDISGIERTWAYLTIKDLLSKTEISDEDKIRFEEKATELAIKYSFVTPLTSMVVLEPNASYWLQMEKASDSIQADLQTLTYLKEFIVKKRYCDSRIMVRILLCSKREFPPRSLTTRLEKILTFIAKKY